MKGVIRFLLVLFALSSALVQAKEPLPSLLNLKKKSFLQYKMWSLSRDYRFGTTLKNNAVNALAWQLLYVNTLPRNYPGKSAVLLPYTQGVAKEQIKEAHQLMLFYQKKYGLAYTLDDKQLAALLFAPNASTLVSKNSKAPSFDAMIKRLLDEHQTKLAEKALRRMRALTLENKYPIVFGQVVVDGPEPAEMVNTQVPLLAHGLFVDTIKPSSLSFSLSGYQTKTVMLDKKKSIHNLGIIELKPTPDKEKTGFVGSVRPWFGLEEGNIIVRQAGQNRIDEDNPWRQPVIPLTVLNSGKFYAMGLTPGRYELIIQVKKVKVSHKFSIQQGHIKGLALIDLRKLIRSS